MSPSPPAAGAELQTAVERVADYIEAVTGLRATEAEIADALGRYFVLNEIREHIDMLRNGS